MKFEVIILGNNYAFPAHGRYPSAQIVDHNEHLYLVDCGEGTQMRMNTYAIKRSRINHIFISHLHGDHIFGLPGLLFSFALNDRSKPVHIYSPEGLQDMIMAQLNPGGQLPYPIYFHVIPTEESDLIFENNNSKSAGL